MNSSACDTPARIAIVGAGPIGLEAALYARFLGYDVTVYERDRVAASAVAFVADGAHGSGSVGIFANLCSPLGLAAIESQDDAYEPPAADSELTAAAWLNCYLMPLAATDLLDGSIKFGCEVLRIGPCVSEETSIDDAGDYEEPAPDRFEIHFRDADAAERVERSAVMIDTTGIGSLEVPLRHIARPAAMAVNVTLPHPHFHLLGFDPKHCGPVSFAYGLTQIRLLFTLIGDRESLDLYAGAASLLKRR